MYNKLYLLTFDGVNQARLHAVRVAVQTAGNMWPQSGVQLCDATHRLFTIVVWRWRAMKSSRARCDVSAIGSVLAQQWVHMWDLYESMALNEMERERRVELSWSSWRYRGKRGNWDGTAEKNGGRSDASLSMIFQIIVRFVIFRIVL